MVIVVVVFFCGVVFVVDFVLSELCFVFFWGGVYVGVLGGYVWNKGIDIFGVVSENFVVNVVIISGFVGYNYEILLLIIVGLEGEFGYDWNKVMMVFGIKVISGLDIVFCGCFGFVYDCVFFYVVGGYVGMVLKFECGMIFVFLWFNGWIIGVGVDYVIIDSLFLCGEYCYV